MTIIEKPLQLSCRRCNDTGWRSTIRICNCETGDTVRASIERAAARGEIAEISDVPCEPRL